MNIKITDTNGNAVVYNQGNMDIDLLRVLAIAFTDKNIVITYFKDKKRIKTK